MSPTIFSTALLNPMDFLCMATAGFFRCNEIDSDSQFLNTALKAE